MKKCQFCGEEIKTEAKKCRFCGEWLTEKPNTQPTVQAEKTSPEAPSKVHYAGFWIRFVSYVIDALIMSLAIYLLSFLGFILYFAYFIILTYWYQATLGKMAVGTKVVSSKSLEKASVGSIIMRETLGKIVSSLILYIGFFMTGFTQRKQALHDFMAETVVVYKN